MTEMKKIEEKILRERRDWIRHFDSYIEYIVHDESNLSAAAIVRKAKELTDARQELLFDLFPEYLDE